MENWKLWRRDELGVQGKDSWGFYYFNHFWNAGLLVGIPSTKWGKVHSAYRPAVEQGYSSRGPCLLQRKQWVTVKQASLWCKLHLCRCDDCVSAQRYAWPLSTAPHFLWSGFLLLTQEALSSYLCRKHWMRQEQMWRVWASPLQIFCQSSSVGQGYNKTWFMTDRNILAKNQH